MLPGQGRTTTTKHVIWLAILFVILLLPLGTHEARRSRDLCKGSEGDDAADCAQSPEAVAAAAASGRRVAPRRAKFKFHKIQRLDDDDDDNDNNDDDGDGDDENDNDNGSDEDVDKADEEENDESSEKANANDDDDDDDDDDDEANADDDDDDNDGDDDDDDAEDDDDADDEEDNDDDDGNDETTDDADDEEPSLLQRIMNIFTSDADTEREPEAAKESPFQLSNIIDWLQSLTEQAVEPAAPKGRKESKREKAQKVVKSEIDWLTYLKRWPFNSIFPEPAAPAPTRRTAPPQGSASGKAKAPSKATKRTASQSEEYLELLIHSLPAFFGNVSEAKSGECHQQLELLHRQLRAHKLWTFQSKMQTRSPAPAPSYSFSFLCFFPSSARCNRQDRGGSAAWEYQSVW